MSDENRNILTALVALSDSFSDVAENIDINEELVIRGINNYDGLDRVEKANLDYAVINYVDNTLENTDPFFKSEINDFVSNLNEINDGKDSSIDPVLKNEFYVLVANGAIEMEQLPGLDIILGNIITLPQQAALFEHIKEESQNIDKEVEQMRLDGVSENEIENYRYHKETIVDRMIDTLEVYDDGEYDFNDHDFWEVARDYFES